MIITIIPARSGSKGVPNKNIKKLGGFPLLAYSIIASRLSKNIDRTIVSTNSMKIAAIAKKYGAEVPFLRPAKFASDISTDFDVINHALICLKKNEKKIPELIVYLRPTSPLRDPKIIDDAIEKILNNKKATSLRSAHQLSEPPQKMFYLNTSGYFSGFFPNDTRTEYYNLPRQNFPPAFHPNGYVDIIKPIIIKEKKVVFGSHIIGFITEKILEIDSIEDFEYLKYVVKNKKNLIQKYLIKNIKRKK